MIRVPAIRGVIERRILVNFRVDPAVLQGVLPAPFRPKLAHGVGMAGICLIRLAEIRPRFVPQLFGLRSENAAHRIAVEWDSPEGVHEAVFIPRRDTSSRLNVLVGGRVFPGEHSPARFTVSETNDSFAVALESADGHTRMKVRGSVAGSLPQGSVFESLEEASRFFEGGALGFSKTSDPRRLDSLELRSLCWRVEPLEVSEVESSFFADPELFPRGSVEFDCALLMRGIPHEWRAHPRMSLPRAPERQCDCELHGRRPATFVCQHIVASLYSGEPVGFHWSADSRDAYPDACCSACHKRHEAEGFEWTGEAEAQLGVKLLCADCYVNARRLALGY